MLRRIIFFIVIQEDIQAIDFDKSIFTKTYPIKPEIGRRFPNVEVEEATKIVLNRKLFGSKSVFYISQDFFDALHYCNKEFKNSIEAKKIKTIDFHPIEEVIEYLDDTYSLELLDTEFIIE